MGNISIRCCDDQRSARTHFPLTYLFLCRGKRYGKSTLLEAIAAHYGFGREGGNRNFSNDSTGSNHSIDLLVRALRLSFDKKTGAGYFLRAESFFNTTSYMDHLDEEVAPHRHPVSAFYGGRSLHTRSHGETFFTLLDLKFRGTGCSSWTSLRQRSRPSASSPSWCWSTTCSGSTKTRNSSFPAILRFCSAIPKAQILSFDGGTIHEVHYEETSPAQIVRHFMNEREGFMQELLKETPSLVPGP